jgi:DNA helicase HerA-like ATPase
MTENGTRIGYVVSISGSKLSGILVKNEGTEDPGELARLADAVQVGALVKVPTPRSIVFGIVSALAIRQPSSPPQVQDGRLIEIDLFGEGRANGNGGQLSFQRGVSAYPGLGDVILATTAEDLAQIYACPEEANVRFGSLYQDSSLPTHLVTDQLLGKHFAILGTTGSGKSCALAVVLRSILSANPYGHIVLLDPHNEYGSAFGDSAELIAPGDLQLPYWLLNFEEAVEVFCSFDGASRETEASILKEAIIGAKQGHVGDNELAGHMTVDTPIPYRLSALLQSIEDAMGKLDKPEQATPYLRLKARIENLRSDRRFGFMFAGLSVRDNLPELLSNLLRIPVSGKPVTILDLSGVPSEIVDVVVSVLCRMIFDFNLWSERGASVPVLFVCEEAHRYIPQDEDAGFGPTRKAIARIAKEGRKYGVSLCLVTQRPSELSETILSQCNTLFLMRMSNEKDQDYVRRAVPENATGMLSALPALQTQEALVIGEGVTLPMRVRLDDLDEVNRPRSETALFSEVWQQDGGERTDLIAQTIERWRRQSR